MQLSPNHRGMIWRQPKFDSINKLEAKRDQKLKSFSKIEKEQIFYFQWAESLISKFTTVPKIAGRENANGFVPKQKLGLEHS